MPIEWGNHLPDVAQRFIRYVKIDTQSDMASQSFPSTAKQFDLARVLRDELLELGLQDVSLDENGYVMGFLPSNVSRPAPVIGFIAHMDTSPDLSGANVKPQVVERYDGGDVVLNAEKNVILSPRDFPEIAEYTGQTLITTDGTTLLGADDKAGVAEIMSAVRRLQQDPSIRHGRIGVAFTPDEEIGRGPERFDLEKFGAELAYTMDGDAVGEINGENFNAAMAVVTFKGRNVHPGSAKGKMVNSIHLSIEFAGMIPTNERPEYTANLEGFYHLQQVRGTVEETVLTYIVRDHDLDRFEAKKKLLADAAEFINQKYGQAVASVEIRDQYFNMSGILEERPKIVENAIQAMREAGIEPKLLPIRGGTDGAQLSYKGLPTPNLFTGGLNYHSRYECVSVQAMEKAVDVIVRLAELYAGSDQ